MSNETVTVMTLEPSQFSGAVVVNVFAMLSMLALVLVALRAIWLAVKLILSRNGAQNHARESVFFRTRMGAYAACMLIGNMFISTGGMIGVWWLAERKVTEGPMCTAQAIFMSMGNIGTAYFTVALAVHTFNSLVLRYRQSAWIGVPVIVIGWGMALAFSLFPLSRSLAVKSVSMYGPGNLTCGIQSVYSNVFFYHHLLPIFLASLLSAIVYSLNFLVLRGSLAFKGGVRLNLNPGARWSGHLGNLDDYHGFVLAIARSMLWYPIAYIALLLPYSVTRVLILSGFTIHPSVVMFAFTCWYMLGVVNVLLLYNTFRLLVPTLNSRLVSSNGTDTESFGGGKSYSTAFGQGAGSVGHSPTMAPYYFPPNVPAKPHLGMLANHKSSSARTGTLPTRTIPGHEHTPSTDGLLTSSDHGYFARAISPVSELNKEFVIVSQPAPVYLHLRTDHMRSLSSESASLPSAPRSTRSPIVRYPSYENSKSVNEEAGTHTVPLSRDLSLHAFRAREIFERDNIPVSPRSSIEVSEFAWQSSDSSTAHVVSSEPTRHPPLSAVASETSFLPDSPTLSDIMQSRPVSVVIRPLPPRPSGAHDESSSGYCIEDATEHSLSNGLDNHVRKPSNSGPKYYF